MVIDIRKLNALLCDGQNIPATSRQAYFAYTKSIMGKATYCLYFTDDITGAVVLHNFIQMLRDYFKPNKIDIRISDKDIVFRNEFLLELLNT